MLPQNGAKVNSAAGDFSRTIPPRGQTRYRQSGKFDVIYKVGDENEGKISIFL
jgi:hypothetical protein